VTDLTIADLRGRNEDLRQLVARLGTIILSNVVEQRELAGIRGSKIALRLLAAVTPVEIVARLRDASMCCTQLSLDCPGSDIANTLERLGVELADEATNLEALFKDLWRK
jgi:hypothetical protein